MIWIVWSNLSIETTRYTVASPDIPEAFRGFTVAQISDLHNARWGPDHRWLTDRLKAEKPDIIVITGDLLDSYDPDVDTALVFLEKAVKIAPCYFITGNHELRLPADYSRLLRQMLELGVTVLDDRSVSLTRGEDSLFLVGIRNRTKLSAAEITRCLPEEGFSLVLDHRPEHIDAHAAAGSRLVLSGHAHGGQLRLPFIGAIFAPGQGIFPKYADGMHTQGDTTLIISRGLGNSSIPIRFCNRPELVIIQLQHA